MDIGLSTAPIQQVAAALHGHDGHTSPSAMAPAHCHDGNTLAQGCRLNLFDPAAWLSSLVEIGGGYALASGRKLWLVVDRCPADELTPLMAQVVGQADRVDALRSVIERRQAGEV